MFSLLANSYNKCLYNKIIIDKLSVLLGDKGDL